MSDSVQSDTMRKAAKIVQAVAYAFREGRYGDEQTSRDIRDAVLTAASVLSDAAEYPDKSIEELLEGEG